MVWTENHLQPGWLLPLCLHGEPPLLGQSRRGWGPLSSSPLPVPPRTRAQAWPHWEREGLRHFRCWAGLGPSPVEAGHAELDRGKACVTSGAGLASDLPWPVSRPLDRHNPMACQPLPRGSLSDLAAYSPAVGSGAACRVLWAVILAVDKVT